MKKIWSLKLAQKVSSNIMQLKRVNSFFLFPTFGDVDDEAEWWHRSDV